MTMEKLGLRSYLISSETSVVILKKRRKKKMSIITEELQEIHRQLHQLLHKIAHLRIKAEREEKKLDRWACEMERKELKKRENNP